MRCDDSNNRNEGGWATTSVHKSADVTVNELTHAGQCHAMQCNEAGERSA